MLIKHVSYYPTSVTAYVTRTQRGVHRTKPKHSGTIQHENVTRASAKRLVDLINWITYELGVGHIGAQKYGWHWLRSAHPPTPVRLPKGGN